MNEVRKTVLGCDGDPILILVVGFSTGPSDVTQMTPGRRSLPTHEYLLTINSAATWSWRLAEQDGPGPTNTKLYSDRVEVIMMKEVSHNSVGAKGEGKVIFCKSPVLTLRRAVS